MNTWSPVVGPVWEVGRTFKRRSLVGGSGSLRMGIKIV